MKKINTTSFFKIHEDQSLDYRISSTSFFFDDNKYFFKFNDDNGAILEAELLATKIGEKLGIDVLHVEPAVFCDKEKNEYLGMMSKNFRIDTLPVVFDFRTSRLIQETCYDVVIKGVKEFVNRTNLMQPAMNVKIESKFYTKLQDMLFFDFLTLQADRFRRNFEFFMKKNKDGWDVCLSPIFDNSWIFGFQEKEFPEFKPTKEYLSNYVFKEHLFIFGYEMYQTYISMKKEILKTFYHNERFKTLAMRAYNIDIDECIAEIENEYPGYEFDQTYRRAAKNCWDITKRTLKVDFGVENLIKEFDDFEK